MIQIPINKIYIDSRHRTMSSRSDADFEIQLNEPINLPDNCICVVNDVLIKNLSTTIEKFNCNVYVRVNNIDKVITLDSRNYDVKDLGDHLTYKLNLAYRTEANPTPFRFVEDIYNTVIIITPLGTMSLRIFTDEELVLNSINWNGPWYDKSKVRSANQVLNNYGTSKTCTYDKPYISERVNLQPLDYVLLNSFGLGNNSYSSRQGEKNVIKKIPLNAYGEMSSVSYFDITDNIPVNKISLTRLKFTVTDPDGNIIDLHGSHISFSLLFISNN
jgi:hypothetical protein